MKKKTIRAKIASLLSASMALAMLAPAMPAQAATQGTLVFDFYENAKDSLTRTGADIENYKIKIPGNIGATIPSEAGLGTVSYTIGTNTFTRTGFPWQSGVSQDPPLNTPLGVYATPYV